MTSLAAVTDRLARADALPVLLDAAYEAFEVLLTVLERHEDPGDARFAAFVSAATCAANGRDAVLFTPSLPPRQLPRSPGEGDPDRGNELDAASAVSALLGERLSRVAEQAADPRRPAWLPDGRRLRPSDPFLAQRERAVMGRAGPVEGRGPARHYQRVTQQ